MRLGRANRPHAKRGIYHASGLWVLACLYGSIMSLWHFCLCGGLSCGLDWLFRFLEKKNVVMLTIYISCSFMVIIFESLGWHHLIILVKLLLKMIL